MQLYHCCFILLNIAVACFYFKNPDRRTLKQHLIMFTCFDKRAESLNACPYGFQLICEKKSSVAISYDLKNHLNLPPSTDK